MAFGGGIRVLWTLFLVHSGTPSGAKQEVPDACFKIPSENPVICLGLKIDVPVVGFIKKLGKSLIPFRS